jgi:hypothetical protein
VAGGAVTGGAVADGAEPGGSIPGGAVPVAGPAGLTVGAEPGWPGAAEPHAVTSHEAAAATAIRVAAGRRDMNMACSF